jgi:hypothetical protein
VPSETVEDYELRHALEPYSIHVSCWAKVYDGGTQVYGQADWADDSGCVCLTCNYSGSIADFRDPKAAR